MSDSTLDALDSMGAPDRGGYFGNLGRLMPETVVSSYVGNAEDLDLVFWNIEWFNKHVADKIEPVARFIADMNCDIWALSETSPQATGLLVAYLRDHFNLDFAFGASEPNAASGKQSTAVMWNTRTVSGGRVEWPDEIENFLRRTSQEDLSDLPDPQIIGEAVHGKIFNRYPGLFYLESLPGRSEQQINFFLVPLHLKAMDEGSLRRKLASQVLASAVAYMIREGHDADWVLGGDINAPLDSGDFAALDEAGLTPLSAQDAQAGAFSYIKGPKSLIDHIYVSPNLASTNSANDFFIVAAEQTVPHYAKEMSDHRPILMRLHAGSDAIAPQPEGNIVPLPEWAASLAKLASE